MNEFGATGASEQPARDGHASPGEQCQASGTPSGQWLVNVADDVVVPMTTTEIVDGVRSGKLSERSLVWRIGMHDWRRLLDVPQLRLATDASVPVPASTHIAVKPPASGQAESLRRRTTLPLGFPAPRDPASVQQPAGLGSLSAVSTPNSTPRLNPPPKPNVAKQRNAPPKARQEESEALAVYDRPVASLTFSDSVRAQWRGDAGLVHQGAAPTLPLVRPDVPLRLTPLPSAPVPLQLRASRAPTTLAPTTAEAEHAPPPRALSPWADLSAVVASEMRAVKASSKRAALWAAVSSALVASVFTLWLVRVPAPASVHPATAPVPLSQLAAQPEAAAEPAPMAARPAPRAPAALVGDALLAQSAAVVGRTQTKARVARPKPAEAVTPQVNAALTSDEPNPYEDVPATDAAQAPSPAPAATVTTAPSVDSTPAPTAAAPAPAPTSAPGL